EPKIKIDDKRANAKRILLNHPSGNDINVMEGEVEAGNNNNDLLLSLNRFTDVAHNISKEALKTAKMSNKITKKNFKISKNLNNTDIETIENTSDRYDEKNEPESTTDDSCAAYAGVRKQVNKKQSRVRGRVDAGRVDVRVPERIVEERYDSSSDSSSGADSNKVSIRNRKTNKKYNNPSIGSRRGAKPIYKIHQECEDGGDIRGDEESADTGYLR